MTEMPNCGTRGTDVDRPAFHAKSAVTTPLYIGGERVWNVWNIYTDISVMYICIPLPRIETRSTVPHLAKNLIGTPKVCGMTPVPRPFRTRSTPQVTGCETDPPRDRISTPHPAETDAQARRAQISSGCPLDAVLWPVSVLVGAGCARPRSVWAMPAGVRGRQAGTDPRGGNRADAGRDSADRSQTTNVVNANPVMDAGLFALPGEIRCTR